MVKKSSFALRKESMYDFLVAGMPQVIQQENMFLKDNIVAYALSGQDEFFKTVHFKPSSDSMKIDVDRDNVQELRKRLAHFVVEHNHNGLIPSFVLLQSQTDFSQAIKENRLDTIVNKWGFNQQILESEKSKPTFFDKRKLKPLEISLISLMQLTDVKDIHIPHKGMYERETTVYNPNKEVLEVNAYKNNTRADPFIITSHDNCYACGRLEDNKFDHQKCKKTKKYQLAVIERTKERYHRNLFIQNEKTRAAGMPIDFEVKSLDVQKLSRIIGKNLPNKEYLIATIPTKE